MDKRMLWLSRVSLLAGLFAILVVGLGAMTRLTDAGLGCPDWPGCYGHMLVPVTAHKALMEMVHRYCAGTLVLLVLLTAVLCVQNAVRYGSSFMVLSIMVFLLIIYQALLGMWTVTLKLWPIVVSQHLLGGMLILAMLWLIYFKSRATLSQYQAPASPIYLKLLLLLGALLVFLQIALGAWTSTNYTALSCAGLPFCHSGAMHYDFKTAFNLIPPLGVNYQGGVLSEVARQTIQMTHRFAALIVTLYLLGLSVLVFLRYRENLPLRQALVMMLGILLVQICLGLLNVLLQLPLITAVLHNLVAAMLFCSVIALNYLVLARQKQTAFVSDGGLCYD